MISTRARTIAPPHPPELPAAHRFPLVATVAPIVVSLVLFAATRSAFTLVFAALGPVVAVASTVDAARERRRARRREASRFESEVVATGNAIDAAHRDERHGAEVGVHVRDLVAQPLAILERWRVPESDVAVRIGTGDRPSTLSYEAPHPGSMALDPPVVAALVELARRASVLVDAPVGARLVTGIGIAGPARPAASVARAIIVQLAAALDPRCWRIEAAADAEEWLSRLPHAVDTAGEAGETAFVLGQRRVRILVAEATTGLPSEVDEVIELSATKSGTIRGVDLRPDFLGQEEAIAISETLAVLADSARMVATVEGRQPDIVEFRAIEGDRIARTGLSAAVGIGESGAVVLDLVSDGPHAIVGGTTGSGKSELLISWVLGMAASRSPAEVTFLFVDFKGGASFGSLLELPHSVGVITDLDEEQALRALASLSAELRHRERELAANGHRGIDDAEITPFPRLIVVVDEYAALVETFPVLHAAFADIAARGRSLGVHLILCTQRPAGVVRDGIMANCALRVSLRVTAAADSVAVLGVDAAVALPARPLGRALVSIAGASPTQFQVALSEPADILRIITRWSDSIRPRSPWLPPLPAHLPLAALAIEPPSDHSKRDDGRGIVFALADLPAEQAQRPVAYHPGEHGSLLVVGAARSGKSGVLAALAGAPSTFEVIWVPPGLPALWDYVETTRSTPVASPSPIDTSQHQRVLLLDDLDSTLANCDEAYHAAIAERLTRLLRDGPATGWTCVVTAQRVGGVLGAVSALCGPVLTLRLPNRMEHALAGADGSEFIAHLPPGAGHWRGQRIQVASAPRPTLAPVQLRSVSIDVTAALFAAVSTRPEQCAAALRELAPGRRIVLLAPPAFGSAPEELAVSNGGSPPILVADPDVWQSHWSLLASIARGHILFDGCSIAHYRALTRSRDLPPPFPAGARSLWLRTPDGDVDRATLVGS